MKIDSLIFNRFNPPQDGWIHLAPFGKHPHSAGLQLVNETSIGKMVENFQKAGKRPLLIDYDHQSHDLKNTTEAAGWIEDIEGRDDGLWGKVRWSEDGEAKIKNGAYRFVSPVWLTTEGQSNGEAVIFPVELKDVALTNQPNLRGLVPVSNRKQIEPEQPNEKRNMKNIAKSLGLDSEATEAQIIEAINRTQSESEGRKTKITELETEVMNSRRNEAENIANQYKLEGDNKKKFTETFVKNREVAMDILSLFPAVKPAQTAQPLTNRNTAQTPGFDAPGEASEAQKKQAEQNAVKVFNRAKEIEKDGVGWNQAFSQAERELAAQG